MNRSAMLFALAVSATVPAHAGSIQFNQEAPVAPYGVPVDAGQAKGDKAALSGADPEAPLPPLPPQPAPPPPFHDRTASPR